MSERTIRLRVFRHRSRDPGPRYDEFEVPVRPGGTVLDALLHVRRHHDPGLALRHSCLHASCGTCGVRVDGREVLACVTGTDELGDRVVVEPLAGAPVVADLVVDMGDFYERLEATGRPLVRAAHDGAAGGDADDGDGAARLDGLVRFEDCIECGLCVSACPVVGGDPRYQGPAALTAAWRVASEPRGSDPAAALALADDGQGAWRCHLAFECSEVCPAGVDPVGAIMALRRRLLRDRLARPLAGRRRR
jgi:succinate dehydrogenase / fumarate reductase iron-sulfur subunit